MNTIQDEIPNIQVPLEYSDMKKSSTFMIDPNAQQRLPSNLKISIALPDFQYEPYPNAAVLMSPKDKTNETGHPISTSFINK